ncbi:FHA domain-containing protein [Calothrix parasitica NIES-267]|uniref:FHA domain-containing protein n=1 Tax=Calothrix parasitica NIES-267 TaxID=1973488 RepID=A0A1Z4LHS0_9CYAN|nr:FHA domain-containing protein [Calothrix parasitica NIES-267]
MSNISKLKFFSEKGSSTTPESIPEELKERLSLYQLFAKLYENHGSLLEQILKSENLSLTPMNLAQSYYMQAVLNGEDVYITTNLCGKSQSLGQSQNTWTIGRDRTSGININNKYISRHHAAVRYVEQESHRNESSTEIETNGVFYLVDFNSTNGTYINGEQIYRPTKLEEGDIIRIGNITFSFFINHSYSVLPTVAIELLMQLVPKTDDMKILKNKAETLNQYHKNKTKTRKLENRELIQEEIKDETVARMKTFEEQLSQEWKSGVLDRFYSKQIATKSVIGGSK